MPGTKGNKNAYGAGNPRQEIAKFGEKTRFGAKEGPDPRAAQKAWVEARRKNGTVRKHLATLAGSDLACKDISKLQLIDFAKVFGFKNVEELTFGHVAAIQFFKQAMSNGKVMMAFIDNVDGKQIEKKMEAKVTLADLLTGNFKKVEGE